MIRAKEPTPTDAAKALRLFAPELAKEALRVSTPPPKAKRKVHSAVPKKAWDDVLQETAAMMKNDENGYPDPWKDATAKHIVALNEIQHRLVYEVEPRLSMPARTKLMALAARVKKRHFDGNIEPMIDYLVWVWRDENQRWRASKSTRRLAFETIFTDQKVVDFQAATKRAGNRR